MAYWEFRDIVHPDFPLAFSKPMPSASEQQPPIISYSPPELGPEGNSWEREGTLLRTKDRDLRDQQQKHLSAWLTLAPQSCSAAEPSRRQYLLLAKEIAAVSEELKRFYARLGCHSPSTKPEREEKTDMVQSEHFDSEGGLIASARQADTATLGPHTAQSETRHIAPFTLIHRSRRTASQSSAESLTERGQQLAERRLQGNHICT